MPPFFLSFPYGFCSPNKVMVPFASCPPQSVFKNYDHDQNGFISQVEFEKIAASFPFSFCVVDKEK